MELPIESIMKNLLFVFNYNIFYLLLLLTDIYSSKKGIKNFKSN